MRSTFSLLPLVLCLFLIAPRPEARAQDVLTLHPESRLWVEGTSNKKKAWRVRAETLRGEVVLSPATEGAPPTVTSATVTIPVEGLVGEVTTGKFIMHRLLREALKMKEHPEISYALQGVAPGEEGALEATGTLTLAGVSREITMPVHLHPLDAGRYRLTGAYALSMPDYQIKPPSVRTLGYHVGPDVTVHFELVLAPAGTP